MSLDRYASFFFFTDTATTEIYTLSLHDALPILRNLTAGEIVGQVLALMRELGPQCGEFLFLVFIRSEEHTSELQSLAYLVCRLLLEKKKKDSVIASLFNSSPINLPPSSSARSTP